MEALANMFIATVDLIEAEGRTLHRQVVHLGLSAAMSLIGLLAALLGIGFVFYGIYLLLAQVMPLPAAAITFGAVVLALSGVSLWTARNILRH
jgi:hypothetical protein